MRRTAITLLCCIFMYIGYMYTLPDTETGIPAAQAAAQPRITATITIPAISMYAVSLGSFDTETEALPYAAMYSTRGAAGCIVETDTGWELLGAGFFSAGEANAACRRQTEDENIPARTILYSSDETHISLTATRAQAEAITYALTLLESVPKELLQISAQVDSGKLTPDTARSLIALRHTEVKNALDILTSELGNTADIFSRMTETGLMELEERLRIFTSDDPPSGLAASSLMKQCALDTILFLTGMSGTLSR